MVSIVAEDEILTEINETDAGWSEFIIKNDTIPIIMKIYS